MSVPGSNSGVINRRQKRMGPAPFASFEDLSDELESPEDKNPAGSVVRLPGIREDATPTPSNTPAPIEHPGFIYTGISLVGAATLSPPNTAMSSLPSPQVSRLGLQTPNTPRIDISRASSSSHHDSRDSTPERELFESHDPATAKLGLGFREEGALDLRSSTEELDFQDPQDVKKKGKARPQSPSSCLHDDLHHQRKDSQSSELGLLCISGRTSRLSSIGSQGSGHSRLSNASHLSVISGQSGLSRSPSPHKMLLETSFCGTKPPDGAPEANAEQTGTKMESEVLEKVLLSRKQDPTQAVLAEGISVVEKLPPEKPIRKVEKRVQSVKSDITIKVDEPQIIGISNNTPKIPRKFVSKSGVEYIYIPLKGPLPVDHESESKASEQRSAAKSKVREVKSATIQSKTNQVTTKPKAKSATPSPVTVKKDDEPKYIRIKLKPDYMYSHDDDPGPTQDNMQKPDTLDLAKKTSPNLTEITTIPKEEPPPRVEPGISLSSTPSASPKLPRQTFLKDNIGSKTPSPSLSRKSSFASLFRSKETILSPESPTVPGCRRKNTITGILREASDSLRERSRSRSKSRERDKSTTLSTAPSSTESIDSKHKQKSVFSRFKSKKAENKSKVDHESTSSSEVLPSIEGIAKVEFKFNDSSKKKYYETPLEGDSIRIPLHSPTHYEDHSILQDLKTSSQDSQETVIEVCRNVEAIVEPVSIEKESNTTKVHSSKPELTKRHSSTSSENVVFSTKLGSNNEIFSTKLPKDKQEKTQITNEVQSPEINFHDRVVTPPQKVQTPQKAVTPPQKPVTPPQKPITPPQKAVTPPQKVVTPPQKNTTRSPSENDTRCKKVEPKPDLSVKKEVNKRNSTVSSAADEDRYSSGSERDSEIDFSKSRKDLELKLDLDYLEPERKGLVVQQDSYEDELPYIPTTLPQERSAAVPIVPVKQRSTFEMKTYPIERPRSTTPINPSCLEEYCEEVMGNFNTETVTKTIEKLKISLPKLESIDKPAKSPRKPSNTNWFEFAEKGINTSGRRSSLTQESDTPPPLPPKGIQKEWINFEEIPERRKPPKRIQTLPSRGHIDVPDSVLQDNVVYNYVNPEECKCECHEITAREREKKEKGNGGGGVQEDELPLLDDEQVDEEKVTSDVAVDRLKLDTAIADRRSIVSDSSVDLSTAIEPPEANGVVKLRTPFTSDLGVSSNRSSIISQDEPESPDSGSPNAFPKTLKPY